MVVELGEFDVSGPTEFMPTRQAKVKRVVVHKDYQAPTFENDIAILERVTKTCLVIGFKCLIYAQLMGPSDCRVETSSN